MTWQNPIQHSIQLNESWALLIYFYWEFSPCRPFSLSSLFTTLYRIISKTIFTNKQIISENFSHKFYFYRRIFSFFVLLSHFDLHRLLCFDNLDLFFSSSFTFISFFFCEKRRESSTTSIRAHLMMLMLLLYRGKSRNKIILLIGFKKYKKKIEKETTMKKKGKERALCALEWYRELIMSRERRIGMTRECAGTQL